MVDEVQYTGGDLDYLPESIALFAKRTSIGVSTSKTRKDLYNAMYTELKSTGQINEVDFLYVVTDNKSAGLINLIDPDIMASIVNDHGSSFTTDRYYTGRSLSSFRIRSSFNPGDGGTYKYKQNDGAFGVYINSSDTTNTGIDLSGGSPANAENQLILFGTSGASRVTMNREQSSSESYNQMYGWHQGKLAVGATRSDFYKNGAKKDENAASGASVAPYNNEWYFFCSHNDAAVSNFSNRNHSAWYGGSSSIDHGIITGIIDKYLIAIGAIPSKQLLIHGNSFTAANTYPNRVLSYYSPGNQVQDCIRGKAGYTIAQLMADFPTGLQTAIKPAYDKQVYFFWELINSMIHNGANAAATYNDLVAYCDMVKAAGARNLLVATMLPANGITPANRQNPLDLFDDTTLNGKIRNHLVQDGHADGIIDVASDPIIGIDSGGVDGVGERNTTYFGADFIHPNTTGYTYIADNWIYPGVSPYLL